MVSRQRVMAVLLRHFYVLKNDFFHVFSDFYWPLFDVIIWGLTSLAFASQGDVSNMGGMVILSLSLWESTHRANGSLFMGITEEMRAQNIINLFASPLRFIEYLLGLSIFAFIKAVVVLILCFVFSFIVFSAPLNLLALSAIPLCVLIIFSGVIIGLLTIGILIVTGQRAESVGWITGWLFAPFSGVFCPFEALPSVAQKIGLWIPTSYFFRIYWAMIRGQVIDGMLWVKGILLLMAYAFGAIFFLWFMFKRSKNNGLVRLHGD